VRSCSISDPKRSAVADATAWVSSSTSTGRTPRCCSGTAKVSGSRSCPRPYARHLPARATRAASPIRTPRSGTHSSTHSAIRSRCRNCSPGHEADDRLRRHLPPVATDASARRSPACHRIVLDMAAEAASTTSISSPRLRAPRMTEAELRHAVGDPVYDAFAPVVSSTTWMPRTPTTWRSSARRSRRGVEIVKRAPNRILLVYVNINLVAMDGAGSHRDGTGELPLTASSPQRAHAPALALVDGPTQQRVAHEQWRMAR